jgi:hypothetical protein
LISFYWTKYFGRTPSRHTGKITGRYLADRSELYRIEAEPRREREQPPARFRKRRTKSGIPAARRKGVGVNAQGEATDSETPERVSHES